jgi:hypothetical protein
MPLHCFAHLTLSRLAAHLSHTLTYILTTSDRDGLRPGDDGQPRFHIQVRPSLSQQAAEQCLQRPPQAHLRHQRQDQYDSQRRAGQNNWADHENLRSWNLE